MTEHVDDFVRVKRHSERGSYERELIYQILDEAIYCHVGFVDDDRPVVIPTIHVRVGNTVVLHGSPASRMMRHLQAGNPFSLACTILDGLVLARSVFNHSMNYRSAVVFGTAKEITERDPKVAAMRTFTEKILPGRWGDARTPTDKEIKGTMMLAMEIDAASAKVRSGPPGDDEDDMALPVWAGVIPYRLAAGRPIAAPDLVEGVEYPDYLDEAFGPD